MTYTSVSTYTRTHTATHLADVILGSIADILGTLGIDATRVFADWDTDQRAISAWIEEGSLASVALECHQPGGAVAPIFEFPVSYVRYRRRRPEVHRRPCRAGPVPCQTANCSDGNRVPALLQLQRLALRPDRMGPGNQSITFGNAFVQFWDACRRTARECRPSLFYEMSVTCHELH